MQRVINWEARRSGGSITINGQDEAGELVKIVDVDKIEAGTPYPIATDKSGACFELLPIS